LFTFIDSIDDLATLNKELIKKPYVAIDTEFRRTTKDNMKLALLQINDNEEIYLVDTIFIKDPKEHCSFLFSEKVTKILHSFKEDLEAILAWTDKCMINIFDTQLANAFLDREFSISYQGLVEKKLDIILDKNETRSNWIRRPLTDSQLKYASLDVEYLIHIYEEQITHLSKTEKLDWMNEDINKIILTAISPPQDNFELKRKISKDREDSILFMFNSSIEEISKNENINSTLFFSKKAQKDFIRLVFLKGIDFALGSITSWRARLIKDDLQNILS